MRSHTLDPHLQQEAAAYLQQSIRLWKEWHPESPDAYLALALQLEQYASRLAMELRREAAGRSEKA